MELRRGVGLTKEPHERACLVFSECAALSLLYAVHLGDRRRIHCRCFVTQCAGSGHTLLKWLESEFPAARCTSIDYKLHRHIESTDISAIRQTRCHFFAQAPSET